MRRLIAISGGLVAALFGLYLFAMSTMSAESVGYRLGGTLYAESGLALVAQGTPELRIYPRPTITLRNVTVADSGRRISGTVERLTADIEIASLVSSTTRFSRIGLHAPDIRFDLRRSESEPLKAGLRKLLGNNDRLPTRIQSTDGRFTFRFDGGTWQHLSSADLDIMRSDNGTVSVAGSANWFDQAIAIDARMSEPAALIDAAPRAARLSVSSDSTVFRFDGHANGFPAVAFDGRFTLETRDLSELIRPFRLDIGDKRTPVPIMLTGDGRFARNGLTLDDARLNLGDAFAVGAVSVAWRDNRIGLDGTLAFERLDATAWFDGLESDALFHRPLKLPPVFEKLLDVDLRLSVGSLAIGSARIDHLAGSVIAGAGRVAVDVGEATFLGGRAGGRLAWEFEGSAGRASFNLAAERLRLSTVIAALGGRGGFDGTGSMRFAGSGSGRTLVELLREFSGAGEIAVADPLVSRTVLTYLLAGGLNAGANTAPVKPGDAAFQAGHAGILVDAGRILLAPVTLQGSDLSLSGKLVVDLVAGAFDITGKAELPEGRQADGATELPFHLTGSVPTPPELARRSRDAQW